MIRSFFVTSILILGLSVGHAQKLTLTKGIILDSIVVQDSISETLSLYIPTQFDNKGKWPVLFVFDMNGKARQALSMYREAAEKHGYIMVSPNALNDSLSISKNVVIIQRALAQVLSLLPINNNRIFASGMGEAGRFANLLPIFIDAFEGVISVNAPMANTELLNGKKKFQHIAIVSKAHQAYPVVLQDSKLLGKLGFSNHTVFVYEDDSLWPKTNYLEKAIWYLNMASMGRGVKKIDSALVQKRYVQELESAKELLENNTPLLAEFEMNAALGAYRLFENRDSLKVAKRNLKKDKLYRSLKRDENAAFFKESLLREDYVYYLEEDLLTYNFNNLGWWNYQMQQLNGFLQGEGKAQQQMGKRLKGFVNELVDDAIYQVKSDAKVDEEGLVLLLMLKTLTDAENHQHYLKVISLASKNEDYGTALFYLEEVLKKGFDDVDALYKLEHTALLRIATEFNALVAKYLKDARYRIDDE